MALNAARAWLVTYDITDPRRLARLHRFLVKQATPVQYSVFLYEGSAARMGRLIGEIDGLIDPSSDDVRAYALPERLAIDTLGRGAMPDCVLILSNTFLSLPTLLGSEAVRGKRSQ